MGSADVIDILLLAGGNRLANHGPAALAAVIIDRYDFETIQKVLALDTRTSVSGRAVEQFSGMVNCGEVLFKSWYSSRSITPSARLS